LLDTLDIKNQNILLITIKFLALFAYIVQRNIILEIIKTKISIILFLNTLIARVLIQYIAQYT